MTAKAAVKALQRPSPQIGRYRLIAPIASGGMASVHLARVEGQAGFSRLVAIKVLHKHLTEDRDFVAMFLDEARFAARIRHPHVVDVYDVETIDGELVIVMQYVEGAALSLLLRESRTRQQPLPLGVLLRALHDALRGLHAAHELADENGEPLGLVHRDVSPQNILLGLDGVGRVTDFGVAKARGRIASTQGAAVKGKTRYLAPEQLQGAQLDRRVDVFAAGIVLWECLTGRSLFSGAHEAETMMAVLSQPIAPPSRHAPSIPVELDRISLRALERDRDKRYPSAAAFADALEDAVGRYFAKVREVSELVEDLHHEELLRLRAAVRLPTDSIPPEYSGAPIPQSASGMRAAPENSVASSGLPVREVSHDPDTRSAVPITSGSRIEFKRKRRAGWLALGSLVIASALAIGYFVGRGPKAAPVSTGASIEALPPVIPIPTASATDIAPEPAKAAATPTSAPLPSANPPATPIAKKAVPRLPPAKKPAGSGKRGGGEPFMPGTL